MNVSHRTQWSQLTQLFARGPAVVLTGAGVSTDSGVPGYRDETGAWLGAAPMQFRDFESSPEARQRYWARSFKGFTRMAHAVPNRAHLALAKLERARRISLLVTQNVDDLHRRAGSERVLDLHGRLSRVVCLSCGAALSRSTLQQRLAVLNRDWKAGNGVLRPDGDVELEHSEYQRFQVVDCDHCGGILKPDVVFFGERVPVERHAQCNDAIESAGLLLVVGTSLMVNSGFRLLRTAERCGVPVAVLNRGTTRADAAAAVKLEGNAGSLLGELTGALV